MKIVYIIISTLCLVAIPVLGACPTFTAGTSVTPGLVLGIEQHSGSDCSDQLARPYVAFQIQGYSDCWFGFLTDNDMGKQRYALLIAAKSNGWMVQFAPMSGNPWPACRVTNVIGELKVVN